MKLLNCASSSWLAEPRTTSFAERGLVVHRWANKWVRTSMGSHRRQHCLPIPCSNLRELRRQPRTLISCPSRPKTLQNPLVRRERITIKTNFNVLEVISIPTISPSTNKTFVNQAQTILFVKPQNRKKSRRSSSLFSLPDSFCLLSVAIFLF